MSYNRKVLDIYLNNINEKGRRICTWKVLAEKHGVSKVTLSRVSSIRKRTTDEQFQIFKECMYNNDRVLLSNGTSSHNIEHICLHLRRGHKITGKGKGSTTHSRIDRSSAYLLKSAGYYKIGVTLDTSIEGRIRALQIGNPHTIELVAKTGTISNAYEIEKTLHNKFKDNRVRGEWFTLEDGDLDLILKTFKDAK